MEVLEKAAAPARRPRKQNHPQAIEAAADPDAWLTMATVSALTGDAPNTIRRMVRNKQFPAPHVLRPRVVRWKAGDVRSYLRGTWVPPA